MKQREKEDKFKKDSYLNKLNTKEKNNESN